MKLLTAIKNIKEMRKDVDVTIAFRNVCEERGYHRVCAEPEKDDGIISCYDCDLWFTREFAKSSHLEYKVEPLE